MTTALLLGGPPGVGKSSLLPHLQDLIPTSAVLDADAVWRVSPDLNVPENGCIAIDNTIAVMRGFFAAGCKVGILSWVFARAELYQPVVAGLEDVVDSILQLYLVADEQTLERRLRERGDVDKLEYSRSRLRLIEQLPFPKIDTRQRTPREVAEEINCILARHII